MLSAENITDASPIVLAVVVGLMLALESLAPLVPLLPGNHRFRHAMANLSIALSTSVFAVGGSVLLVAVAQWATVHRWGLLNLPNEVPWVLRFAVALVGIDLFEWFRHRLHHRIPVLWRLHRVHHTDPHVDATTAIRGHPFESVLAYGYFALVVLLLGLDPLSLACRSLLAVAALAWHHSKFRLPTRLDSLISLVTPTPRTHRLHHSRDVRFTDSNFGTLFTWWDRLAGTFAPGHQQAPLPTGLDGFDTPHAQSWWGVLRSPFEPNSFRLFPDEAVDHQQADAKHNG